MQHKVGNRLIILFFIVFCSIWGIWFFLEKYVDSNNNENREMSIKPSLSFDNYAEYPMQYEAYLNDNIPFRSSLISINNKIDFFLFHKSTNEDITIGTDGWLFLNDTMEDYQHTNLYSEKELEIIRMDVENTKEYFDKEGIEFIIFIGPNKSTIYGDKVQERFEVNSGLSRTEQVVQYLRKTTDVTIIYPKDELLEARKKYPELQLFFKIDTHWNYMGGYFGTLPLLEELGIQTKDLDEINYEQVNEPAFAWNGYDLANMLGLTDILDEDINYIIDGYSTVDAEYVGDVSNDFSVFSGVARTYSDADDKRKIYLARDSFAQAMTPYLATSFAEIVSVYRLNEAYTKTNIIAENPDVFIYEMVERSDWSGIDCSEWGE